LAGELVAIAAKYAFTVAVCLAVKFADAAFAKFILPAINNVVMAKTILLLFIYILLYEICEDISFSKIHAT
jgi:hypothetical protein